jgi:predicted nucleic acid-binding protein
VRLYLDANAIIYSLEGRPGLRKAVLGTINAARASGGGALITSRLSFLEVTVKPYRNGDTPLLDRYAEFFRSFVMLEVTSAVVHRARDIRAQFGFQVPDALHLATAVEEKADVFLTGDAKLLRFGDVVVRLLETDG